MADNLVLSEQDTFFSTSEIMAYPPFTGIGPEHTKDATLRARTRMEVAKVWSSNQILGRRYPVGCVALEITQRCNLDCTLCYLSEHSESTKDIPLEEVYRRIRMIRDHYGPGTDVQISGGDPTLRKRSELMAIVRYIRETGLRPTLMTNGIAAKRDMLIELVENGLNDIAFHVDLTQERKGFDSEVALNAVRKEYIERARGLKVAVIFNTTVFGGNFHEVPDLVRFFRKNADVVGMASFQMQADTGRGILKKRDDLISLDSMVAQIEKGAGTRVSFETARIGHPRCHRYGLTLEANGNLYDFFDDQDFFNLLIEKTKTLELDRTRPYKVVSTIFHWLIKEKEILIPAAKFLAKKLWAMKKDLLLGKGKVHKLSFFMQNFMDASSLEKDRVHACSFMVMTPQGPLSMCMHNAKRDAYILQPLKVKGHEGVWNPLTGKFESVVPEKVESKPKLDSESADLSFG